MPEFDKRAIVEAYREDIISMEEAREGLGFGASRVYEEYKEIGDLRAEIKQLDDVIAAMRKDVREKDELAKGAYLRGYKDGKRDGVLRPLWVGLDPAPPTKPTFTYSTLGPKA